MLGSSNKEVKAVVRKKVQQGRGDIPNRRKREIPRPVESRALKCGWMEPSVQDVEMHGRGFLMSQSSHTRSPRSWAHFKLDGTKGQVTRFKYNRGSVA